MRRPGLSAHEAARRPRSTRRSAVGRLEEVAAHGGDAAPLHLLRADGARGARHAASGVASARARAPARGARTRARRAADARAGRDPDGVGREAAALVVRRDVERDRSAASVARRGRHGERGPRNRRRRGRGHAERTRWSPGAGAILGERRVATVRGDRVRLREERVLEVGGAAREREHGEAHREPRWRASRERGLKETGEDVVVGRGLRDDRHAREERERDRAERRGEYVAREHDGEETHGRAARSRRRARLSSRSVRARSVAGPHVVSSAQSIIGLDSPVLAEERARGAAAVVSGSTRSAARRAIARATSSGGGRARARRRARAPRQRASHVVRGAHARASEHFVERERAAARDRAGRAAEDSTPSATRRARSLVWIAHAEPTFAASSIRSRPDAIAVDRLERRPGRRCLRVPNPEGPGGAARRRAAVARWSRTSATRAPSCRTPRPRRVARDTVARRRVARIAARVDLARAALEAAGLHHAAATRQGEARAWRERVLRMDEREGRRRGARLGRASRSALVERVLIAAMSSAPSRSVSARGRRRTSPRSA